MHSQKEKHLFGPEKKHILSLDGGGVRGVVSLVFLQKLESQLKEHYKAGDSFRLCDHFALIGGTSTGSIIATCLALGFSASQILEFYTTMAKDAFGKKRWFGGGIIAPKFPSKPLLFLLKKIIGDRTLGSDDLRCGLAIVSKRLDTNSVWVFHNHPNGPFYGHDDHDLSKLDFTPNKDLPLINLIRASTAAPTFFEPESIKIAHDVEGVFVDGGVSPYNNPSLLLFMLATIKGYGFNWRKGVKNMSILSVGTGKVHPKILNRVDSKSFSTKIAIQSMLSMMLDADQLTQTMMQWMGACDNPDVIDSEIGDLSRDNISTEPLFEYERFNIQLNKKWLKDKHNINLSDKEIEELREMDNPDHITQLINMSKLASEKFLTKN